MQIFSVDANVHHLVLNTARDAHGLISATGTYKHFIFGYVGNYFESIVNRTRDNIICAGIMLGRLTIRIEAVPFGGAPSLDNVNNWTLIQCEDVLSRNGKVDVMGLNTSPSRWAKQGPGRPRSPD